MIQALNPPMEDRIRDFDESPNLPAPADWRKSLSPRVGGILNPQTQIVRSNHFKGWIDNVKNKLILIICNIHISI